MELTYYPELHLLPHLMHTARALAQAIAGTPGTTLTLGCTPPEKGGNVALIYQLEQHDPRDPLIARSSVAEATVEFGQTSGDDECDILIVSYLKRRGVYCTKAQELRAQYPQKPVLAAEVAQEITTVLLDFFAHDHATTVVSANWKHLQAAPGDEAEG